MSDQILECRCKGRNPSCVNCDGTGIVEDRAFAAKYQHIYDARSLKRRPRSSKGSARNFSEHPRKIFPLGFKPPSRGRSSFGPHASDQGEQVFRCPICRQILVHGIIRHLVDHHVFGKRKPCNECPECGVNFKGKLALMRHYYSQHNGLLTDSQRKVALAAIRREERRKKSNKVRRSTTYISQYKHTDRSNKRPGI